LNDLADCVELKRGEVSSVVCPVKPRKIKESFAHIREHSSDTHKIDEIYLDVTGQISVDTEICDVVGGVDSRRHEAVLAGVCRQVCDARHLRIGDVVPHYNTRFLEVTRVNVAFREIGDKGVRCSVCRQTDECAVPGEGVQVPGDKSRRRSE
jgi:hypothetical protein